LSSPEKTEIFSLNVKIISFQTIFFGFYFPNSLDNKKQKGQQQNTLLGSWIQTRMIWR
jgi:hypothetical protein